MKKEHDYLRCLRDFRFSPCDSSLMDKKQNRTTSWSPKLPSDSLRYSA
ncbi:MAG: hypothetical protein Q4D38_00750 [Planctomycetia bacterium]|nr:hypothetical protein [Planctomycetia bacterium]